MTTLTALRANAWKYAAIALGLGLGFALLMQTIRLADAKLEAAHAETTMQTERAATAQAALKNSERYRKLEGTHRDEVSKTDTDAQAAIATADAGHGIMRMQAFKMCHPRLPGADASIGRQHRGHPARGILADPQVGGVGLGEGLFVLALDRSLHRRAQRGLDRVD